MLGNVVFVHRMSDNSYIFCLFAKIQVWMNAQTQVNIIKIKMSIFILLRLVKHLKIDMFMLVRLRRNKHVNICLV